MVLQHASRGAARGKGGLACTTGNPRRLSIAFTRSRRRVSRRREEEREQRSPQRRGGGNEIEKRGRQRRSVAHLRFGAQRPKNRTWRPGWHKARAACDCDHIVGRLKAWEACSPAATPFAPGPVSGTLPKRYVQLILQVPVQGPGGRVGRRGKRLIFGPFIAANEQGPPRKEAPAQSPSGLVCLQRFEHFTVSHTTRTRTLHSPVRISSRVVARLAGSGERRKADGGVLVACSRLAS